MALLPAPLLWATLVVPPAIPLVGMALGAGQGAYRTIARLLALALLSPSIIIAAGWLRGPEPLLDPLVIDLSAANVGSLGLFIDGLSAPIVIGISLVTSLVSVYSLVYMAVRIRELEERGERPPGMLAYYALYALFSSSMLGMAYSTNLLEFYLFLEISLVTSFLLIAYYGYGDRMRIALLYFVWTHIGGGLFLVGALFYGSFTGSFDIVALSQGSIEYVGLGERIAGIAGLAPLLLLLGLLVKMAVVGVHMWLPYAHAEAPTPVSALLSPNLVGIAGYAIARFLVVISPGIMGELKPALALIGFATIIYGGLVALRQNDFKRFLAYSSISQMGYILVGISTLTAFGIAGSMMFYLSHALGKAILFMTAGVFIAELSGLRSIDGMGGLARVYPAIAASSLIGFLHLAGIPPSFGFWGELLILLGIAEAFPPGGPGLLLALSSLIIASFFVTALYSFTAMKRIFFGPQRIMGDDRGLDEFKATILLLSILGLFLFAAAGPLFDLARDSTLELLESAGVV